jgi:spore coat protein U-like protein
MNQRIAVLLMLGLMPWAGLQAQSQTATTTFKVTTRVDAVCAVTATDLNFGTYSAQGAPLQGTTQVVATCTPGTTYNIGLNAGSTTGATINQRKMAGTPATNTLNYQLYSDSAHSIIWGNTPGTDTVTGAGTGLAVNHAVYGQVPAAQLVPAGNYQDVITVSIFY